MSQKRSDLISNLRGSVLERLLVHLLLFDFLVLGSSLGDLRGATALPTGRRRGRGAAVVGRLNILVDGLLGATTAAARAWTLDGGGLGRLLLGWGGLGLVIGVAHRFTGVLDVREPVVDCFWRTACVPEGQ